MIDAVSQCPRLFQIEGSWRPGTMTSSSCSISLRARDFYAGRYSRLCVEKKRQLKQAFLLFFSLPTNHLVPSNRLAVALSKLKSGLLEVVV